MGANTLLGEVWWYGRIIIVCFALSFFASMLATSCATPSGTEASLDSRVDLTIPSPYEIGGTPIRVYKERVQGIDCIIAVQDSKGISLSCNWEDN